MDPCATIEINELTSLFYFIFFKIILQLQSLQKLNVGDFTTFNSGTFQTKDTNGTAFLLITFINSNLFSIDSMSL